MHEMITLLAANGLTVLQQMDRGPLAWQLRCVCNADKVVVYVTHEHGTTTVVADDPMGQRVRARVEALLPAKKKPRGRKPKATS